VSLKKLYKKYGDKFEFITVYLSEAHAMEEWNLATTPISRLMHKFAGAKVAIDVPQHKSFEERISMATKCKNSLLGEMPVFVDKMDNRVAKMYNGWPTRLFLIGKDGRIVYNPGPGPWSFNPAYLGPEIEKYLADTKL